jgi:hypothetical protein
MSHDMHQLDRYHLFASTIYIIFKFQSFHSSTNFQSIFTTKTWVIPEKIPNGIIMY